MYFSLAPNSRRRDSIYYKTGSAYRPSGANPQGYNNYMFEVKDRENTCQKEKVGAKFGGSDIKVGRAINHTICVGSSSILSIHQVIIT